MTGELCDCYPNREAGVRAILDALAAAAPGAPMRLWTTAGHFVESAAARASPATVASANWLALATFAGRFAPRGSALLIDIGTTTIDIIGLHDGVPCPVGRTDKERLQSGELVYRGWRRTPLCALGGGAAELFATTHDMCLLLGLAAEDPDDHDTADGRMATIAAAHARVARMLGADVGTSTERERMAYIEDIYSRLLRDVAVGWERVAAGLRHPPERILLAGSGEFLARRLLKQEKLAHSAAVWSLNHLLGQDRSTAACAYAAAVLSLEREGVP
jgi:probable H4MPT-linked C1 transfer pathway protein